MLGRGRPSYWKDNDLISGQGSERRGGGHYVEHAVGARVHRRVFMLNGPVKDGGALYLYNCRNVEVMNCLFLLNCAKWGGGVYLEKCSNVTIYNNIFAGNFAYRDGGAISASYSREIHIYRNVTLLNIAFRSHPSYDIFHCTEVDVR